MTENFYDILGVSKSATDAEIKKQYRLLTKKYHPDTAGDTPENMEMFSKVQKAYEVLSDPIQRALYDNPVTMPSSKRGVRIHRKSWRGNRDKVHHKEPKRTASGRTRERWQKPENDVSLDDILGGSKNRKQTSSGTAKGPKSATDYAAEGARSVMGEGPDGDSDNYENKPHKKNQNTYQADRATQGDDIELDVDVSSDLARRGGSVTLEYTRLVRSDSMQLVPYEDLVIVYITPNTKNGDVIQMDRRGHMGEHGGPTGNLFCHVVIVDEMGNPENRQQRNPKNASQDTNTSSPQAENLLPKNGIMTLPITISEAVLGGRVAMHTPMGRVMLVIPPSSSSGKQLRIRGKGVEGNDLIVELKIMIPKNIDEESQRLIEEFARRNPIVPNR